MIEPEIGIPMKLFDPKCGELARHFLGEFASHRLVLCLAVELQICVEGWLEKEKDQIERIINARREAGIRR